jgi:hypothetical protein
MIHPEPEYLKMLLLLKRAKCVSILYPDRGIAKRYTKIRLGYDNGDTLPYWITAYTDKYSDDMVNSRNWGDHLEAIGWGLGTFYDRYNKELIVIE